MDSSATHAAYLLRHSYISCDVAALRGFKGDLTQRLIAAVLCGSVIAAQNQPRPLCQHRISSRVASDASNSTDR